jgi:hypothetical protein
VINDDVDFLASKYGMERVEKLLKDFNISIDADMEDDDEEA